MPESWALIFKTLDKMATRNQRRFPKSKQLLQMVTISMLFWDNPFPLATDALKMRIFIQINIDIIKMKAG